MRKRLGSLLRSWARRLDPWRPRRPRWTREAEAERGAALRRGPVVSLAELDELRQNPIAYSFVGGRHPWARRRGING